MIIKAGSLCTHGGSPGADFLRESVFMDGGQIGELLASVVLPELGGFDMSIASRAVKRLRGLYRVVFRRMRAHEARLFDGLGRPGGIISPAGVGLCVAGLSRTCRIEQLEPRLLLDAGPQVVSHLPAGLSRPIDQLEITFNEPIDPATLSADDVLVMHSSPVLLGNYNTPGNARGVTLAGNLAYVADYQSGLQILDVTDPAAPVRLGGYDTADNALVVDVSGNLAYVAHYTSGLQIIDVSDPAAPVGLGVCDTPGIAYGVAVASTTAYVADFFMGLQIIDVSDPAAPVRLGGYNTAGLAYGVAVSGTTAYVADRAAGLEIIDVSDPAAPVLLGTCDTPGSAYAVTVAGTRAYVADDTAGLQIIDISDPSAPALLGAYDTPGNAYGVSVSGRLAYVSDGMSGVQVIDVSDPSAPVLLTAYDTAGIAYGAAISGGRAYIADGGTGVQVHSRRRDGRAGYRHPRRGRRRDAGRCDDLPREPVRPAGRRRLHRARIPGRGGPRRQRNGPGRRRDRRRTAGRPVHVQLRRRRDAADGPRRPGVRG